MTGPCDECLEVEVLARVLAVRDLLDALVWAEAPPMPAVNAAIAALQAARRTLVRAGHEAGS